RQPDSPPIGSGCWSLTVNSPLKIDHLVTFISCQILTWPRAYRKFRKWRSRFRRLVSAENLPRNPREEPAPRASDRFAAPAFPTNMAQTMGGGTHDHREMHQRV